jgi:hypothetical protein
LEIWWAMLALDGDMSGSKKKSLEAQFGFEMSQSMIVRDVKLVAYGWIKRIGTKTTVSGIPV